MEWGFVWRAKNFFESLQARNDLNDPYVECDVTDSPLTTDEVAQLESLYGPCPDALKTFYLTEPKAANFVYCIDEPYLNGGFTLSSPLGEDSAVACVRSWEHDGSSERQELVREAWPIFEVEGDFVALDCRNKSIEPPVVLIPLSGEPHSPVAPNFETFLRHWESLCYVLPEYYSLEPYLNDDGRLDPNCEDAIQVRNLFQRPEATGNSP